MEMDNLNELAEMVCRGGAKGVGTIQLELESHTHAYVYNVLLITSKYICEILFGYQDLTRMTRYQFEKLREYVLSLDYKITVTANKGSKTPWDLIDNKETVDSVEIEFKKLTKGIDYM
jgi:hypothetical protein